MVCETVLRNMVMDNRIVTPSGRKWSIKNLHKLSDAYDGKADISIEMKCKTLDGKFHEVFWFGGFL